MYMQWNIVLVILLPSCVSLYYNARGLQLPRNLCPWDCPCKNTGVYCHFLLWGTFLTQRLNTQLLQWQVDFFPLTHQGNLVEYYSAIKRTKMYLKNKDAGTSVIPQSLEIQA